MRRASIALCAACRCVPWAAVPRNAARVRVRPAASGQRNQDSGCRLKVGMFELAASRTGHSVLGRSIGCCRRSPRTGSRGQEPTVATGSFLASRLIEIAVEPTSIRSPERGPAEVLHVGRRVLSSCASALPQQCCTMGVSRSKRTQSNLPAGIALTQHRIQGQWNGTR